MSCPLFTYGLVSLSVLDCYVVVTLFADIMFGVLLDVFTFYNNLLTSFTNDCVISFTPCASFFSVLDGLCEPVVNDIRKFVVCLIF